MPALRLTLTIRAIEEDEHVAHGVGLHTSHLRSNLLSRVQPAGLGEGARMQMAELFQALWESGGNSLNHVNRLSEERSAGLQTGMIS